MFDVRDVNNEQQFNFNDMIHVVFRNGNEQVAFIECVEVTADNQQTLCFQAEYQLEPIELATVHGDHSKIKSLSLIDTSNIQLPQPILKYVELLSGDPLFEKVARNTINRYKKGLYLSYINSLQLSQWSISVDMYTDMDFYIEKEYRISREFVGESFDEAKRALFKWLDEAQYSGSQFTHFVNDIVPDIKKKITNGEDFYWGGNWDFSIEIDKPAAKSPTVISEKNFGFFIESVNLTT